MTAGTGRKQFRVEAGMLIALASNCVDCGSDKVYSLDRCQAHYMREYRRLRAAQRVLAIPAAADVPQVETLPEAQAPLVAPAKGKGPKLTAKALIEKQKPRSWQPTKDSDFLPAKAGNFLEK